MRRELSWIWFAGLAAGLVYAGCGGASHTSRDGGPGADGGGSGSCDAPLIECGGSCVDPRFDPSHCGACGMACGAGSLCASGVCTTSCGGALIECGGSCVDPRFDPANCGGCGAACAAGEVCNSGSCAGSCGLGTEECEGRCVDTQIDPDNCGVCGVACADGEVCNAGSCGLSCSGGTVLCGASCVDIASNASHCGACDNPCPAGTACRDGSCGMRPTVDADGDTISDFDEAATASRDTDGDGTPDARDSDSDADGLSDATEAGDTDVMSPPADSDGDGLPDFRDLDSDNDGLSDADETTMHGTDPTDADSDGDGETDAVEIAGGSDPTNPASTVAGSGDFTFDLPPGGMARTDVLQFNPRIRRADVLFLVDTTGSMGGTITGLRTELNNIVSDVRTAVPDTAFGVARFDDFPVSGYGSAGLDVPFGLIQRITTSMPAITSGVAGLTLHGGADLPESQIEAFYQAATGAGFRSAGGVAWVPVFMAATGFDATLGHGMIGGAGFRMDAQPIVIMATDITFHRKWTDVTVAAGNRATWCGDTSSDSCDAYGAGFFGAAADQQPKTVAEAVGALNGIGARVLGLAVDGGAGSDQRNELSAFAVATGAFVEPVGGMCSTGVSGAMRAAEMWDPDGTGPAAARLLCPLVFSSTSGGSGVRAGIVSAITSLTSFVSFATLHTEARDDASTPVDESRFFVRGIPVSYDTATCSPAPTVADRLRGAPPMPGADGTLDSFTSVVPGCLVSFQIVAENDGFVSATCSDQIYSVSVIIVGNDTVEADRRTIVVRVPGDRSLCTP